MSDELLATLFPVIIEQEDLTSAEVLALGALAAFCDQDCAEIGWLGCVFETNLAIARWMHYKEPATVSRVLKRLQAKGYIEQGYPPGGRIIFLCHPDLWPA